MLKATFTVEDIAKLHMEASADHTFTPKPIFTKRFTKVIMAGPVPVILTGQMKFMAVADVESSATIDATLDTGMTFTLNYGLHYDGSNWSPVKDASSSYHVKVEAEGQTETTFTVRLIPDFHIEVYELAVAHLLAEPYLYATVGVEGKVVAQVSNSDNTYIDSNSRFTKMEAGAGMDLRVYAGAAWKTRIKSLKYPSTATYAQIGGASFMNPNHRSILAEYYDTTRSYEKFTVFDKTAIASIPALTKEDPFYNEKPPSSIDSRAIKVKVGYQNIENPLHSLNIGKKYYIEFSSWDYAKSITDNAQILPAGVEGEYWVVPTVESDGSLYDTDVRFVAHSNLGMWARQTIDVSLETATSSGELQSYWAGRYAPSGETLSPYGDPDGDLYSNLLEYQNGTNPNDASDHPTGDPDTVAEDTTKPVFTSSATVSVNENQTSAITLVATDESGVIYDILGGDHASFSINSSTGVVTFKTAPDYETKTAYTFTATATDANINEQTQTVTINILDVDETVPDITPPVITILGDNPTMVTIDSAYSDAGATAVDAVDGNRPVTIVRNTVDPSVEGDYEIVYHASDTAGNEVNATRVVRVTAADIIPPTAIATTTPTSTTHGEVIHI